LPTDACLSPEPDMPNRAGFASAVLAAGVAAGILVSLCGLSQSWDPFEHTVCVDQGTWVTAPVWVPEALLNSPYGDNVTGGTSSLQILPGPNGVNGAAEYLATQSNVTVTRRTNQTVVGLGSSMPCLRPFRVTIVEQPFEAGGFAIMGPGNRSDAVEPHTFSLFGVPSVAFDNDFQNANAPEISTCGHPAETFTVSTTRLTLGLPFVGGGSNETVPYAVSGLADTFTYGFPADFGTWEVDNLSADGGPGGGWAFDYLGPCP
jgi:hypothetical protein